MNEPIDLRLAQWLADGPDTGARESLARTLETTRATAQRPRWRFPSAWLPLGPAVPRAGRPIPVATILIVALVATALVVAALVAGSRPRLPAPFGIAGNGGIAYASGGEIFVTDPDGTNPRPLAATGGTQSAPAFTPTGDRIAFWSLPTTGPAQLIVANADGSAARDVLGGVVSRAVATKTAPAWSPDGSELAFVLRERPTSSRLFIARADGRGVRELPVGTGVIADPAWSPAGDRLAFRRTVDPDVSIVTVRPDGTDPRTLVTETVGPSGPDDPGGHGYNLGRTMQGFGWSPDARRIAFTSASADVKVVDLEQGLRSIADDPASAEFNPAWSPSGRWLAYYASDGEAIVIADVDGTARRRLDAAWTSHPCLLFWSPDERHLLSSNGPSCPDAAGQLVAMNLETGVATRLPDEVRADDLPSQRRVAP